MTDGDLLKNTIFFEGHNGSQIKKKPFKTEVYIQEKKVDK